MEHIAIDFTPILKEWGFKANLNPVYEYYPLKDIISGILRMRAYEDHNDLFWIELEERHPNTDIFNLDLLQLALENLVEDLDLTVRRIINNDDIYGEYVMLSWITKTSAVFVKVENSYPIDLTPLNTSKDTYAKYNGIMQPSDSSLEIDRELLYPRGLKFR